MSGRPTRRDFVNEVAFIAVGVAALKGPTGAKWHRPAATATLQGSGEIAERISRIENGVLPQPALRSQVPEKSKLTDRMKHYKVPGVSIAVIHNDRIEWARSYGVRETGASKPLTTEALLQAGSISKPVAAVAALRMVEAGRLNLGEDVNKYLVSWKVPKNGAWRPRVMIRQLLSHSAGLTVHGFPGYPRYQKRPTLIQILDGKKPANTPAIQVDSIPGTQFRYSGGGYCVLQQVLMDVTGKPFPMLMQELVLDPIGMKNSTCEQPLPGARWGAAATGHRSDGEEVEGNWHVYPEMAAAGPWTTPSDLARFAIEVQLSKAGKSNKVLSADMAKQLLAPQVEEHIGLGLFLTGKGETARFGYGGWDEGFVCELVAYQDGGKGAVVMTNSDLGGSQLIPEILRGIAREYSWPDYISPEQTPAPVDPHSYDTCMGKYELRPGYHITIKKDGNTLSLEPPGQGSMELYPESETKYFLKVVNAEVTFIREGGGTVTGLTIRQNGRDMSAKKIG